MSKPIIPFNISFDILYIKLDLAILTYIITFYKLVSLPKSM